MNGEMIINKMTERIGQLERDKIILACQLEELMKRLEEKTEEVEN